MDPTNNTSEVGEAHILLEVQEVETGGQEDGELGEEMVPVIVAGQPLQNPAAQPPGLAPGSDEAVIEALIPFMSDRQTADRLSLTKRAYFAYKIHTMGVESMKGAKNNVERIIADGMADHIWTEHFLPPFCTRTFSAYMTEKVRAAVKNNKKRR